MLRLDYEDEQASRLENFYRLSAYLLLAHNIFVDLRPEVE